MEVEISLNSIPLQARAAAYVCNFTLNTSSLAPTPIPESRSITFSGHAYIAATPNALLSHITLRNTSQLVSSGYLRFEVKPTDATGMVVRDAVFASFYATLHHATIPSVPCRILYDNMADLHLGECRLPSLVAGAFALRVLDSTGDTVSGQQHNVSVTRCPSTFVLDVTDHNRSCTCPAGYSMPGSECVLCAAGTAKATFGTSECIKCQESIGETSTADGTQCSSCLPGYYRDEDNSVCRMCPPGVTCPKHSRITDWDLGAGLWRSDSISTKVMACKFGQLSCPGSTPNTCVGNGSLCACGYRGPLCSECDPNFFVSWAGDSCENCSDAKGHFPTMVLGGAIFLGGLVALVFVKWSPRCKGTKLEQFLSQAERMRQMSKAKFFILLLTAQVIAQFSAVVNSTADANGSYPQPAAGLAALLGVTNLDVFSFVPLKCFGVQTDFYDVSEEQQHDNTTRHHSQSMSRAVPSPTGSPDQVYWADCGSSPHVVVPPGQILDGALAQGSCSICGGPLSALD